MLSHTRMGVPYEYTHMGRPIRVWANICIWGRTTLTGNGLGQVKRCATQTGKRIKISPIINRPPGDMSCVDSY